MTKLPNILLTMCDDQRHSAMSCCDGPTADAVKTPNLDALAARGLRFRRAQHAGSHSPAVCSPSRAMLHSGRGPFDVAVDMVDGDLASGYRGPAGPATLGQLLRAAGYTTHLVGKWHNYEDSFRRSFDGGSSVFMAGMEDHFNLPVSQYDGQTLTKPFSTLGVHATDRFAASASGFLRDHAAGASADRPFFLCVAFTAPHDPRRTHAQWHERYPAQDMTLPPNFLPVHPFDHGDMDVRDELLTSLPRDPDQTGREISDYFAMTEHMDHAVGQIHATLEQLGLADNTLVVHTSDHGLAVGQHGLLGKQFMYDHSIRVPLLMAGPGITADTTSDARVYQHDLFPTFLQSAGIDRPDRCAFESLWPVIDGESQETYPEGVGSFYREAQRSFSVGDRKVIAYHVEDGPPRYQQFDTAADPWEQELSLRTEAEVDADLLEGLRAWQRKMGDPLLTI
ncbi:MAG: sulfatase-like hydrolase/transferase [Planctomycetota bacterium]